MRIQLCFQDCFEENTNGHSGKITDLLCTGVLVSASEVLTSAFCASDLFETSKNDPNRKVVVRSCVIVFKLLR